MATPRDLRKAKRKILVRPQIAAILFETSDSKEIKFIEVLNRSIQGVLIRSVIPLENQLELTLILKNEEFDLWDTFYSRVVWAQEPNTESQFHVGLEFLFPVEQQADPTITTAAHISGKDVDFILNTKLIAALPQSGLCAFLNCMTRQTIDKGRCVVSKGEDSFDLYLIQKGLCSVHTDNTEGQAVSFRREGDVIGSLAFLTASPSGSSFIAQSRLVVWLLPRKLFDDACKSYPEIKIFLTLLLTRRMENTNRTAVRRISRYTMTHLMGKGDLSIIYAGRHWALDIPVTIQMINHTCAMNRDFLTRFRLDSKLIMRLDHPNIARIYDIREKYRTVFMIMEPLEGEPLNVLLERKEILPYARIFNILIQTASGLAYAHKKKIIHHNVRPAALYISNDDRVKLINFGLGYAAGKEELSGTSTVYYISPEQATADPVDFLSDIYSFGILAFEMFTGHKPFEGENADEIMKMHAKKALPDPKSYVPDLPDAVKQLIEKACDKRKNARFSSMKEIVAQLKSIYTSLNLEILPQNPEEHETAVMLIPYRKSQIRQVDELLDEFYLLAQEKGLSLRTAGKTIL